MKRSPDFDQSTGKRRGRCACPETGPVGVQLRRTRGWRMPPNTVSVARPSRWGNPFRVGDRSPGNHAILMDAEHACQCYEGMLEAKKEAGTLKEFLAPLRGKNLACYCPLGQPCHRDVLLRWLKKPNRQ